MKPRFDSPPLQPEASSPQGGGRRRYQKSSMEATAFRAGSNGVKIVTFNHDRGYTVQFILLRQMS